MTDGRVGVVVMVVVVAGVVGEWPVAAFCAGSEGA